MITLGLARELEPLREGGHITTRTQITDLGIEVRAALAALGNAYTPGSGSEVHLVLGASAQTFKPCENHPERYCNCEGYYPACREAALSTTGEKS
ncbi:hypothetical protein X766_16030 [Mesorhizobium sp. LSJC255A00]|nr:hypothetical protein X766_16030 [Mesorhizobium sp. LSJC255A00]